jgi:hypothetical protein
MTWCAYAAFCVKIEEISMWISVVKQSQDIISIGKDSEKQKAVLL